MMTLRPVTIATALLVLVSIGAGSPAIAQDLQSGAGWQSVHLSPGYSSADWSFFLAPYFLQVQADGQISVASVTAPLNLESDFVASKFQSGAAFRFEARNQEKWGGALDLAYLEIGDDKVLDGSVADWKATMLTWEVFGLYRLMQTPTRTFDALAGVRYKDLDFELKVTGAVQGSGALDIDWTDPIVGGRYIQNLTRYLLLIARADVGGFGVGSDLTWHFQGGLGYMAGGFGLFLQYKHIDFDYEDGEGSTYRAYDAAEKGALLGIGFTF